jgi:hypothetical protein
MEIQITSNQNELKQKILSFLSVEFPLLASQIQGFKESQDGKGFLIEFKPLRTRRSRSQENYYRKYCNAFGKFCGLTPDEMHEELLCQCYGSIEVETRFGVKRRPAKRSADATRGDFSDLIETLCRIAAEVGFQIPPPQPQEFE